MRWFTILWKTYFIDCPVLNRLPLNRLGGAASDEQLLQFGILFPLGTNLRGGHISVGRFSCWHSHFEIGILLSWCFGTYILSPLHSTTLWTHSLPCTPCPPPTWPQTHLAEIYILRALNILWNGRLHKHLRSIALLFIQILEGYIPHVRRSILWLLFVWWTYAVTLWWWSEVFVLLVIQVMKELPSLSFHLYRILQQLRKDHAGVQTPDQRRFASVDEALQRLLPYHVFQGAPPSQDEFSQGMA